MVVTVVVYLHVITLLVEVDDLTYTISFVAIYSIDSSLGLLSQFFMHQCM